MNPQDKAYTLMHQVVPRQNFYTETTIRVQGKSGHIYFIHSDALTEKWYRNKYLVSYCIQLTMPAPSYDRMVMEYLLIKNNEAFYLKTANPLSRSRLITYRLLFAIGATMIIVGCLLFGTYIVYRIHH